VADDTKQNEVTIPNSSAEFDAHRVIVVWLFISTFILVLFTTGALLHSASTGKEILSTLVVVVIAGVLGSFVSALNRIYSSKDIFPNGKYRDFLKGASGYLIAYSTIPPLVGAISAAVLYVVFAGQIISGALFPEFACAPKGNGCTEFVAFLDNWSPKNPQDFAKAIVWGFMAGFSERLVPDILNKVSSDAIAS
jgi:hypothetical protein